MKPRPRIEILVVLLLATAPIRLHSLESLPKEIPPPVPPFIAKPPEFSAWTIQSKSAQGGAETAANAIHTQGLARFETGGREVWYSHDVALMAADNDPSKIVLMAPPAPGPMPDGSLGSLDSGPGFPGFWWLDINNYQGVVKINGRPCHHFRLEPPPVQPPPSEPTGPPVKKTIGGREFIVEERPSTSRAKPLEAEAWIDVETKLPAAILAGGRLHTYTFLAPPTSMLSLPTNMSDALKLQKSRAERLRKLEKKFRQTPGSDTR
jgi:hypothetical protein